MRTEISPGSELEHEHEAPHRTAPTKDCILLLPSRRTRELEKRAGQTVVRPGHNETPLDITLQHGLSDQRVRPAILKQHLVVISGGRLQTPEHFSPSPGCYRSKRCRPYRLPTQSADVNQPVRRNVIRGCIAHPRCPLSASSKEPPSRLLIRQIESGAVAMHSGPASWSLARYVQLLPAVVADGPYIVQRYPVAAAPVFIPPSLLRLSRAQHRQP